MARQKARVYIDGFNLYYRAVKGTPYKWLNLAKLCQFLLPEYEITAIRYFTAIVESRPGDPQQQQRQQAYIRALETAPLLTVHYGLFQTNVVRLALAHPSPSGPKTVEVLRTEEKGSDVNLATYLLADGFESRYDVGVVMSNDSDLIEPINVVRGDIGLPIGVVITDPKTVKSKLPADFTRRIKLRNLRACQFPERLTDATGVIHKPATW
jgi:uncharacterized LabA/DUF88 family protein